MGKRNKRARIMLKKASILGEEISPEVARRYGIESRLPQKTNTEKIEELKTTQPEVVVETPTTIEEPAFMTEAPKVVVEEPKVEVKKKTTTRKRAPRKTTTRARKTNTKSKVKSISSEK
tara:strand:+ start:154 stop:510 length:357 start_codon:yes stop_codon:yes gene_type:complete